MSRRRSNENRKLLCGNSRRNLCTNRARWIVPSYTILSGRRGNVAMDGVKYWEQRLCDKHFMNFAHTTLQNIVFSIARVEAQGRLA